MLDNWLLDAEYGQLFKSNAMGTVIYAIFVMGRIKAVSRYRCSASVPLLGALRLVLLATS